jgi:hypothetical protein
MLLLIQVWSLAAFGGGAAAAEEAAGAGAEAGAAREWSPADAELAVLSYLAEAQRADAWTAYAEAMARMRADAAVQARFGLASPDEAAQWDGLWASAAKERDAAKQAREAARARLAERMASVAPAALAGPAAGPAHGEAADGGATDDGGTAAASDGEAPAETGKNGGADAAGAPAARDAVPYPETLLQAGRAMRQACRQIEAEELLLKAGVGSTARLAEAHAGCLRAELAWIDVQAEGFAALLMGASESAGRPVPLPELLVLVRDREPALYDRWIRHLKADAACPSDAAAGAPATVRVSGGAKAERLTGCLIGIPGIRIDTPPQAIRTADGAVYLPLKPYAVALGMSLEWNGAERRIALKAGERELSVAPGSAAIAWSGGSHEMAHAVLTVNGQSFVPAEFFGFLFGLKLYWDDNVRAGWLLPASA